MGPCVGLGEKELPRLAGERPDMRVMAVVPRDAGPGVFGVVHGVDHQLTDVIVLESVDHLRSQPDPSESQCRLGGGHAGSPHRASSAFSITSGRAGWIQYCPRAMSWPPSPKLIAWISGWINDEA